MATVAASIFLGIKINHFGSFKEGKKKYTNRKKKPCPTFLNDRSMFWLFAFEVNF